MRTPGQSIVESVEEEGVVTVSAGHATHPRNIGHGSRGGRGGREVDDPLTVGSGTRDPLTAALADEETVAGTPHILPTWGSVPDRRGLVTRVTLDHMLRKHHIRTVLFSFFSRVSSSYCLIWFEKVPGPSCQKYQWWCCTLCS